MMNPPMANPRATRESGVIERFLESPNEESFADLFSRGCEGGLSEDLSQEVMLTVYRKAAQSRSITFSRLDIQDCTQCPLQIVRQAVA
jgi:hypothetical protein